MTGSILLHGGEVLTDAGLRRTDLLVRDGSVAAIGHDLTGDVALDCSGCWIGPGFVDLHTHLREPGQEHKEDMASGAAAAAAGGYTAILAMPNTSPAIDTGERAAASLTRAGEISTLEIGVAGAVTEGREGRRLAELEAMLDLGVRWFTDDGDSVASAGLLYAAFSAMKGHDATVSEHAEDASLTAGALMHAGEVADELGVTGMPAIAETLIIARDLQVARETGGSLHIQHVSTAAAVQLIAEAKGEGLPVTAEATPHHLAFDHTELRRRDPLFKMKPPLRTPEDVAAVRAGLVDGTIDLVATDHAPHSEAETAQAGLEDGAFGVIGLETAAAAVTTWLGSRPEMLFDRMAIGPARIGGFSRHGKLPAVGAPANLAVFDPSLEWVPNEFRSRSRNCPWIGRTVRGRVRATIFEGTISYEDGPT